MRTRAPTGVKRRCCRQPAGLPAAAGCPGCCWQARGGSRAEGARHPEVLPAVRLAGRTAPAAARHRQQSYAAET
eukprot:363625-Chlamydomonas_euryale.AAC.23